MVWKTENTTKLIANRGVRYLLNLVPWERIWLQCRISTGQYITCGGNFDVRSQSKVVSPLVAIAGYLWKLKHGDAWRRKGFASRQFGFTTASDVFKVPGMVLSFAVRNFFRAKLTKGHRRQNKRPQCLCMLWRSDDVHFSSPGPCGRIFRAAPKLGKIVRNRRVHVGLNGLDQAEPALFFMLIQRKHGELDQDERKRVCAAEEVALRFLNVHSVWQVNPASMQAKVQKNMQALCSSQI